MLKFEVESEDDEQQLVMLLMHSFSPMIRSSLAESNEFVSSFNLGVSATVTFGSDDPSFDQGQLFGSIKQLYIGEDGCVIINDQHGSDYSLRFAERSGNIFIKAEAEDRIIELPSFWFLSPDLGHRARKFDELVVSKNLHGIDVDIWKQKLEAGPLVGFEIDKFLLYTEMNVVDVPVKIRSSLTSGSISIASLIPQSLTYYERLVGISSGVDTLETYVSDVAARHINQMVNWDRLRGLAQALTLASHGTIGSLIHLNNYEASEVVEFFKWISTSGDRFSQVSAVEIGLRHLKKFPDLEIHLKKIIEEICDDDPESEHSRARLTSILVVFVDGELSRTGILTDWPPFLRRLASIAHASLIERELLHSGIDILSFSEWALNARGSIFYLQTFVDLRREPRWLPDFIDSHQLKAEFISRIANAGMASEDRGMSLDFKRFLCSQDTEIGGVRTRLKFPLSFLPGPLEGGSVSPADLPQELLADLHKPVQGVFLESKFFAGIVNSALIFKITPEHAGLVMDALRSVNHRLNLSDEPHLTFPLLSGLAMISAVTRTPELAKDVILLANSLCKRDSTKMPPENLIRIGLIAAAANLDLENWCKVVGDWFLEVAYGDLDGGKAAAIRSQLHQLCRMVPQLWRSCGKADSALAAASGW
ncbi:hypothetical protein ACYQR9_15395 [Methylobacterium sp. CM6241]